MIFMYVYRCMNCQPADYNRQYQCHYRKKSLSEGELLKPDMLTLSDVCGT